MQKYSVKCTCHHCGACTLTHRATQGKKTWTQGQCTGSTSCKSIQILHHVSYIQYDISASSCSLTYKIVASVNPENDGVVVECQSSEENHWSHELFEPGKICWCRARIILINLHRLSLSAFDQVWSSLCCWEKRKEFSATQPFNMMLHYVEVSLLKTAAWCVRMIKVNQNSLNHNITYCSLVSFTVNSFVKAIT